MPGQALVANAGSSATATEGCSRSQTSDPVIAVGSACSLAGYGFTEKQVRAAF